MHAYLKNYRQSPRKVRLLADFVRGKDVSRALTELSFVTKRASEPMRKLIESASANAKTNHGLEQTDLYIKEIRVDKGFTLHRFMPRAFGRATPINKRTSNVTVVLAPREQRESETSGKETVEANSAKS